MVAPLTVDVVTHEIRLGDWRDVLPGTYDPARAVVITDPPFGLDGANGNKGYADAIPWADHVRAVLELLPAVRHVIRGPAPFVILRDYPQPRRLCIEVTRMRRVGALRPGVIPHLWHGWAVYGRLAVGRHRRAPLGDAVMIRPYVDDDLRARVASNGNANHAAITPYDAAVWAIDTWADPGMIVLDPFAGTGTLERVATSLGFDYLGAELEPRWHEEAMRGLGLAAPRLEFGA